MSGQYVGSKPTIQSLKDFADSLQKISDSFGATPEQLSKFKEIGEEIKSLGNLSGDTFTSMKNYIIEEINNAGLLSDVSNPAQYSGHLELIWLHQYLFLRLA